MAQPCTGYEIGEESNPVFTAAAACSNGSIRMGGGAWRDITVATNTWYNWVAPGSFPANSNAYRVRPTNGNALTVTLSAGQSSIAWFSGTTTNVRVSTNRTTCTWSTTSTILTYRHTQPSLAANSPSSATICVGGSVSIAGGTATNGFRYWQGTTSNGSSTATSTTPNSTGTLNTAGTFNYYYRPNNNGCWGTQQSTAVTVIADPVAPTITRLPDVGTVCEGQPLTVTASGGSGGTGACSHEYRYSVNNGSTYTGWSTTVPSLTAVVGTTIVQVRRICTGSGCESSVNQVSWTVVADPVSPVITKSPNVASVCTGAALTVTVAAGSGGTGTCNDQYRFSTDNGATWSAWTTTVPNIASAPVGTTRVQSRRDCSGSGCNSNVNEVIWTVEPDPVAPGLSKTPNVTEVCAGTSLAATPTSGSGGTGTCNDQYRFSTDNGGSWSAWSGSPPAPITAVAGTTIIQSRRICTGTQCDTDMNQVSWTVNANPTPTFSSFGGPYCISQTTPISLVPFGSPAGGVFSGNGVVNGNDFVPSLAAVGTNTLTYTYTDGNSCQASVTQTVQVTGLPLVNFSGLSSAGYCINNSTPVPLTGFPTGGTFSGNGISGSNFTPSAAGVGLHSITYTYTDANGCVNSETQSVNVFALPTVGIFDLAPQYCVTDPVVTVTGFPPGGTFSGTGMSGSQFNPATATVGGPYTITYSYTDANSCSNSATAQVTVNAVTNADAGADGNSCTLGFQLGAVPSVGTGTWSLASGPGTVTFTPNANAANATATVSAYGTYSFNWTEVNGACSSSDQVTVNYYQQPVANAGSGGTECDFNFNLNATASVGIGLWTQTAGPGSSSFVNSSSASTEVSVSQSGTYTYTWTETNGTCSSSDPVTVTFTDQPVANAGPDADECDLDHVLAATGSFGTGTWAYVSGPGTPSFSPPNSPTVTVTVDLYGQYVFEWEEVNGTCSDASTVTINFYEQPVADAGFGGFECDLDFDLAANASVGTGTWTQTGGPGTSDFTPNANDPAATVTVSQYGTYTFQWEEVNGTCSDSDAINVTFDQQTNADAGSGGDECDLTFTFNGTSSVGTGIWTSSGPGTAFYTNDNSPTSDVTVSQYGTYVFTWTETSGSCITSDAVTVNFYEQPVANAGQGGSSCDFNFTFNAVASAGTGTWTQTGGPGTGTYDDENVAAATVTVDQYGTYTFQWEEVNGTCSDAASITVDFYEQPVADAGVGGDECDLDFSLNATLTSGTGLWTQTSGSGNATFSDATSPNATVTVDQYDTYTFEWTETNGTCSDAASVTVNFYEQPVADAGSGGDECDLDFVLNATLSTGSGTGLWTQTSGSGTATFSDDTSPNATVTVDQYDTYTFEWTETNGTCSDAASVTVNFWNQPVADAGTGGDECDLNFDLNASPSLGSGEWTQSTGPGTSVFVSETSANTMVTVDLYGTYTYIWTETNGTCISSDSVIVNYYDQPVADAGQGGSECDLDFTFNGTLSTGTGVWTQSSGPGFSNFIPNAADPTATVQVSQQGQYTYTWTETNGSCSDAQTVTVDFFTQPVANAGPVTDQCDLDITLAAILSSGTGTWTFTGPGTGVFTPDANDPNATLTVDTYGTYDLTWTETNGTCSDAATVTVVFNPLPVVSFTGLAATYCTDQTSPVQLTGTPSGGVYSGTGISGSLFIPSIAGVGTHDVTYTYTDANGCIDSETQSVDVMPIPVVSFTGLAAEYCVSDGSQNGLTGTPSGGSFSGPGIVGDDFIAATAGTGTHTITYSYTDGFGCVGTATQTVTVNPLPMVSFTGLAAAYCVDAVQVVLSPAPAGGVFSGPGMTGVTFNPATAGVGTHDIEYEYTDGNGCVNSVTQSVTVNVLPQPVVSPNGTQEICAGSSLVLDAGNGFAQYSWSNGQNGQTLSVTTAGEYIVTVTSQQGCSATSDAVEIIVNTLPVVDLGNDTILCPGNFYTLDAGNPGMDYLWSTQEVTQQISVGSTGFYTVQVTDGNGCVGTDDVLVSFSSLLQPVITAGGAINFCQGGSVMLSGPSGLTYEWSTGETTQNIVVTQSGPVELTVTDQYGCSGVSNTINVNADQLPNAVITPSGSTNLCQGASVTLTASNSFGDYMWNPTGSTEQSITVSQAGSYTVTVTDPVNGCSATSQPVVVTQSQGTQPTIVANGPLEFCVGGSVMLSVEPAGAFTSFEWTTGSITPSVTITGSAEVGVSVMDASGCLNQSLLANPTVVTVWNPVPIVEQSGGALAVVNGPFECYQWFRNGNPIPGAVTAIFSPEFSGNHYVQVCDENGCYANSSNLEITVGIADVRDLYDLNIYPNPGNGQFTVEADLGTHTDVTLTIRDMLGRELMQAERIEGVSSFRRSFDISHLSNGIYYVQVLGNGGMTVRPVVKR